MTSIAEKVEHVKAATQTRLHECHWPGCKHQVPPAMWGCKHHWNMLPRPLRTKLWQAYRPGQEDDMKPSQEYIAAAQAIQDWIARYRRQRESVRWIG